MGRVIQNNFRVRKRYGRIKQIIDIPNLIDIQKRSYDKFLQLDIPPDRRDEVGLQGVFKSVFPIKDFSGPPRWSSSSYNLERPKYDEDECRAARHDLRRADQGHDPAHHLRRQRGDRRAQSSATSRSRRSTSARSR
jgi:DNA-directed RNA polymerase beta subunit